MGEDLSTSHTDSFFVEGNVLEEIILEVILTATTMIVTVVVVVALGRNKGSVTSIRWKAHSQDVEETSGPSLAKKVKKDKFLSIFDPK